MATNVDASSPIAPEHLTSKLKLMQSEKKLQAIGKKSPKCWDQNHLTS